ncbi:KAP family P-loop NTPase fold protein [Cucumibacter marinus]|uniref:KAP family P-loop NTPase fold protein n=1 Tax=Cucumibacter marinus TaxID=1121252 RepID=UPI000428906C|nr:P-loop NTPase fold protein [Cucumibacter marinus]
MLAGRLNQIWDDLAAGNGHGRPLPGHERDPKPGFVVHVDAPWGGGKTSFVRYLTRILNPYRHAGTPPDWLRELPMADPDYWPEGYRRPWRIVWFNAWQREHVSPPWWVFYETIRKQITHAAVTEIEAVKPAPGLPESEPPKPDVPAPVGKDYRYASGFGRWARGPEGWLGEMWWRLQRPAILVSAGVAILSVAIIWVMSLFGLSTVVFDGGLPKFEFKDNPFGLLLLLFTGAGAVTTIVTALTRSLFPGTPDAATNYSLGSGDPHEHFRRHFARRMKGARLPVLVVVDDLDRCQPDYVVEMIRGMQTILQSERVVFILLGDRDWIEHSFAGAFKAMNGIDVGPEHSFGGRFVEKAIQLSLMLPDIDPEVRRDYVNALIDIEQPEEPEGGAELRADGVDLNALTASFVAQSQAALRNDDIRERDTQIAAARAPLEAFKADAKVAAAIRQVSTQRALRSAGDKTLEKVTKVRLAGLADYLPANPRQIKRIINAISLWQQVALMEADMEPGEAEWQKLVRWIVIMVEWPKSWFTLSHYPDLVTLVYTPQAETEGLELPEKATEIARLIRETDNVRDLLDLKRPGPGWSHTRIEKTDVDLFKRILPPTSGSFLAPAGDGDAGDAKQDRDGQTGHKGES